MCRDAQHLRWVQCVSFSLKYKSFFSAWICYSIIWATLLVLLNWITSLDPELWKNIENTLMYLHKYTPASWISGQMRMNKSDTTGLDFSCCRNYFFSVQNVQCSHLSLIGYLTQRNMVGTGFNCLVAAKVLLTLESIHPSTSQLLTTGCLCSEMPEEQLLDHVPKWSDCYIDRIFLGFNFAQTSFSAKRMTEDCG